MEAWARGSISLTDWESDKNKYGVNITGRPDEGADVIINKGNFDPTAAIDKSVIKGDHVFMPGPMIIDKKKDRLKLLEYVKQQVEKGDVKASCWPGFAFYGNTFPANMWNMFSREEQQAATKFSGFDGKIIYALDGQPLSRILTSGITVTDTGGEELPDWLSAIHGYVWEKIKAGEVEMRRIASGAEHVVAGFPGFLALLTPVGDSVLLLSYEHAKAAYVVKKGVKMEDGSETDWDTAIDHIMRTLRAEYQMARKEDPGIGQTAPRQPKLQLSDWLYSTGNGYRMRRDFNVERIKTIIDQGINYADALDTA